MDARTAERPARTTVPVEAALAVANLAAALWCVWAAGDSAILEGPRGLSRYAWIARGYLAELVLLACAILAAIAGSVRYARWLRLAWGSLGALTGLAVLGAWSIGLMLLPGVVLASIAGWLAALRTGTPVAPLLAWAVAAFVCQAGLMMLVVAVALRIL